MKTNETKLPCMPILLVITLAAAASAVGCSSNRPAKPASQPMEANAQPASVQSVALSTPQAPPRNESKAARPKPSASKLITYRSRDYGISFTYPWQYAYVSGKSVGRDESQAASSDDRLTLARVEVPKGFYPDTDFESGVLTVSLNQSLDEAGCYATLGGTQGAEPQRRTINSVPFRWTETEEGGHGKAVKQRTYLTFANDTCYQLQAVVKTSNEGALARDLDPDQVLRRLDAIIQTVKLSGVAATDPVASLTGSAAASQD